MKVLACHQTRLHKPMGVHQDNKLQLASHCQEEEQDRVSMTEESRYSRDTTAEIYQDFKRDYVQAKQTRPSVESSSQ